MCMFHHYQEIHTGTCLAVSKHIWSVFKQQVHLPNLFMVWAPIEINSVLILHSSPHGGFPCTHRTPATTTTNRPIHQRLERLTGLDCYFTCFSLSLCRPCNIFGKGLLGTARSSLFLSVYCSSAWLVFIPLLYYTLLWYIVDPVVFFIFLVWRSILALRKQRTFSYYLPIK